MTKNLLPLITLLFCFSANAEWLTLSMTNVPELRVLNGEVEAINKATVSSQTSGRVSQIHFDVDDFVTKSSIIVEFTNTQQKAALKQAKANAEAFKISYQQAVIDFERTKEIYEKKLVAKSELDKVISNRDSLKAQLKAAEASVEQAVKLLEYTQIVAPYDGIVTKRYVENGETVNPGTPIMEGLSLSDLRVTTNIPETIISQIKSKTEATILLKGEEIASEKITIFPYADNRTHTFKARINFKSDQHTLFPGMTVKVAFKVGDYQTILVPQSVIIHRGELSLVQVKNNNTSLLRHVKLGRTHGDMIEVLSGLSVDEEVKMSPLNQASN